MRKQGIKKRQVIENPGIIEYSTLWKSFCNSLKLDICEIVKEIENT
jgi:hypothetical protein